jgi:apolipoprotein N-acyltransferase
VPDADLALWPESAFFGPEPVSASCPTIKGCIRAVGEKKYNSAIIENDGEVTCYDKCNLVPYSESRFTPGTETVSIDLSGCRVGVAICYDICFADFMRKLSTCDLILVLANEASDPTMNLARQLLAMAQLRAIEARCTIIRNANGGYSGMIDGNGVLYPVELDFRTAIRLEPAQLDSRFSLYAHLGDWLPIACVLAIILDFTNRTAPSHSKTFTPPA